MIIIKFILLFYGFTYFFWNGIILLEIKFDLNIKFLDQIASGDVNEELLIRNLIISGIAILIGLLIRTKKKSKDNNQDSKNSNIKSKKLKPSPKGLIIALFILIYFGSEIFILFTQDLTSLSSWWYEISLKLWENKIILFIVGGILVLISLIDEVIFTKNDTEANALFILQSNDLGLFSLFKQYLAPITSCAPLYCGEKDKRIIPIRKLFALIAIVFKFFVPLFGLISLTIPFLSGGEIIMPPTTAIYVSCIFIFLPELDVILYSFFKTIGLVEVVSYKVKTTYTDGSTETKTKHQSNFIALLILLLFIYICYSLFFFIPAANKSCRIIETNKMHKYLKKYGGESIVDAYREY